VGVIFQWGDAAIYTRRMVSESDISVGEMYRTPLLRGVAGNISVREMDVRHC